MVVWKPPKVNTDAARIISLDHLHKILQVINDPQSLTCLRDSFRHMRGYKQEQHPLHDVDEGFKQVHIAILVRGKALGFTLRANRFYDQ